MCFGKARNLLGTNSSSTTRPLVLGRPESLKRLRSLNKVQAGYVKCITLIISLFVIYITYLSWLYFFFFFFSRKYSIFYPLKHVTH